MEKRSSLFPYRSSIRKIVGYRSEHYALGIISKEVNEIPYILAYSARRGSGKWMFRLPGSRQLSGEEPVSTLCRACREKIGVTLKPNECEQLQDIGTMFGYSQKIFFVDATGRELFLRKEMRTFTESVGGKVRKEEWKAPEWVPLCFAMENLFPTHKAFLTLSLPIIQRLKPSYRKFLSFDRLTMVRSHKNIPFVKTFRGFFGMQACCNG
ncbi:MAG: hypothetical protein U1D31_00480 [Patescibacteria group bacterium]|nr:hypothetical protein [bacterium]MDZ4240597.1 hypothetical protein [Patescibacteria group bacterium]